MPYGLGPTADALLDRDYPGVSTAPPPGITDATRQGWNTQLEGLANQSNVANDWSNRIGNFSTSQYRGGGGGGGGYSADNTPGITQGEAWKMGMPGRIDHVNSVGVDPYGRLGNQVNQVGASFDPFNPMLLQMVQEANQQLGRDFNQAVMPGMNQGFVGAGPGAYGSTRAGITEGLAQQGLADAMQRQTTGMMGQGYEAGLGRYVQDRGQTLGATGQLQDLIAQNARTAQGHNVNMDLTYNDMMSRDVWNRLSAEQADIANLRSANASRYGASQAAGAARYAAGRSADASLAQTKLEAERLAASLANQGAGYITDIGTRMSDFGGYMEDQNRDVANWYNTGFNDAAAYPNQQMNDYTGWMSNIHTPGENPGVSQAPGTVAPPYKSPFEGAFEGAAGGTYIYDSVQNRRNQNKTPGTP